MQAGRKGRQAERMWHFGHHIQNGTGALQLPRLCGYAAQ